ncbi:MAG: hypothetical protein AAFP20_19255 [Cyanobacteria bacterium J06614_10]
MGNRYSRIRQGAQLNTALTNYINHLTTPRTPNVGSRGPRDPRKSVYVTPFGFDIATGEVVRATNAIDAYTALAAQINAAGTGGEVTDTLGSKTIAQVGSFSPARIVWFRNATLSTQVVKSDITKLDYLKYNGDRSSCAFGREAADDNMYDAFDAIKAAILSGNAGLELNRVSLTRERYNYR